jgi:hypothetical protein
MAFCTSAYGQVFFYFEAKVLTADKKPLTYNIFLNSKWDGSAAARINFKDPATGKSRLVKLSLVDNDFPDASDTDKVVNLLPFGDAYDESDKPEKNFMFPRFQFTKTKSYGNLVGAAAKVYFSYNNKQWYAPISSTYQEFEYRTDGPAGLKTQALVKRFFNKNEAFYQGYFNMNNPKFTADEKRRKMFFLFIAATDDPKIGITTQIDLIHFQDFLLSVDGGTPLNPDRLGFTISSDEVSGKNFTKKAVNNAIDKLKPGPRDIVFIYYSGHGFRYSDDTSKYPRIALVANGSQSPDNDNIAVEDIYKRVLKKGARVTIVLADCCNENYGSSPREGKSQPQYANAPAYTPMNYTNARALFLPSKPVAILACAAEKDQLAAGNVQLGGFFTHFIYTELRNSIYDRYGYAEASWTRILNNAKEYTRRQALTADCKGGPCDGDRSLQRPLFIVTTK